VKPLACLLLFASAAAAQMRVVALPGNSPLIAFRIVFTTGAAADPPSKPGLAYLSASMLSDGSTKTQTYQQIEDALFPMAASFHSQVDKEMTTFIGETHADNLEAYYRLVRGMLFEPGWARGGFQTSQRRRHQRNQVRPSQQRRGISQGSAVQRDIPRHVLQPLFHGYGDFARSHHA